MGKPSKESIMQIYMLKDAFCEYEMNVIKPEEYEWLVYEYNSDPYEGSGKAVALRKDGQLQYADLGHCSCYGPLEGWLGATPVSIEEFFKVSDNIHDPYWSESLKAKVEELLKI
jgi:hypothetical protein